ncbi:MAG: hypothetical protein ACI9MJ_001224 [Alphaproteobacteria bacterium]|jgi:hypothetical protein
MGIAASFAVPVFLQLAAIGVDGNIVTTFLTAATADTAEGAAKGLSSLAIIMGFCVLAAVSSRTFLKNLSDKLAHEAKAEAKDARTEAQHAEETAKQAGKSAHRRAEALEEIISKNREAMPEEDLDPDDLAEEKNVSEAASTQPESREGINRQDWQLTELDRQILRALAAKPATKRSIKGIRTDPNVTGAPTYATCRQRLYRMAEAGYVVMLGKAEDGKLPRWKLAANGWAMVD